MLGCIFLLNDDANILIEKQYRTHIDRNVVNNVCNELKNKKTIPRSIFHSGQYTIITHLEDQIWFLGVFESDDFAPAGISLFQNIVLMIKNFLPKQCTEFAIKNEFPTIYQILDLAIDFGYPFLDEYNTIQTVLNRPKAKLSTGIRLKLDLDMPWRSCDVMHFPNDLHVKCLETIDITMSKFGKIEFCHIKGSININSEISETPLIHLFLAHADQIEDICYHRCVNNPELNNIDQNKSIDFIPPDGKFCLLTYQKSSIKILPLLIVPKFSWTKSNVIFEIGIKIDSQYENSLQDINITFNFPSQVSPPNFSLKSYEGKASFDPISHEVSWKLPKLKPSNEYVFFSGAASHSPDMNYSDINPIVSAKFTLTGILPSGMCISNVQIDRIHLTPHKYIIYEANAGNYDFYSK